MRASTAFAIATAMAMLMLVPAPATAQETQHGGSIANTHNDLYVVQEDAENPQGIEREYGQLFVKETVSFANEDPLKVPDYGIVYVDPTSHPDPATPIVTKYTHEYTIANYTLQLINLTDNYVGNFTGYTSTSATLRPGIDLGPEGEGQPHPKVNATYLWQVFSVTEQDRQLLGEFGGEVTTEIYNDTVFDWSEIDLPGIGPHTYEADSTDLGILTLSSVMEPHPSLSEGWYKFTITDEVFEYGVSFTIELRYTMDIEGRRVVMDKLIFTARTIHVDVYHKGDMEVIMYSELGAKGTKVPPTAASTGSGDPTQFTTETTFSLVVQEEGTDGTDWAQYGRYALLGVLIVVLLFLVLWSGRGKREEAPEEVPEDPETAERRVRLEEEKEVILNQMKELDARHDQGEMGTGVYNRKRRTLKARAVEVMRQLEELDGGARSEAVEDEDGAAEEEAEGEAEEEDADDGDAPVHTGKRAELEADKAEVLERIRQLDASHEDGDVSDDVWKRKRKHLKAEAIEIIQEIEALEGD